jgi:hypothetical protein
MIFLVLAVACSTGIAVIFKVTGDRFDLIALLTVNYLVALVTAVVRLQIDGSPEGFISHPAMLALGVTLGALFIGSFSLFSIAIGVAGISLATATMRLSVALPFLASWWVWGEVPTTGQALGLAAAALAFLLISRPSAPASTARTAQIGTSAGSAKGPLFIAGVLVLLFVIGGTVDTTLKVFEEEFAPFTSRPLFLTMVFSSAFVIGSMITLFRVWRGSVWPPTSILGWGALLGLLNYWSTEFILLALDVLPGTIVFPANNVAIVGCATVLGVLVWHERLSTIKRTGLLVSALALVLLAF